ncbi:MAG: tRNA lysidine(34) synthetase TilS [Phascolarctobacterium sp.]
MVINPLVFKVHRVLREALAPEKHYLLAVSGGSDSMALAAACWQLQSEGWASFSVCHVEHGLRGEESLRDMALVQRFCAEHQLPCYVHQVKVRELAAREHLSIEAAARRLRQAALAQTMQQLGAACVVFAHNLDDQAETVLLRLLRGTSLTGLCGIRAESDSGLHPLLGLRHRELAQYCELVGVEYCHDSTNDDLAFTRNRVRHELLPYLEQHFNSNIKETLARMAQQLVPEEEFLDEQAFAAFVQAKTEQESQNALPNQDDDDAESSHGGKARRVVFAEKELLKKPIAMRRRVIREAYRSLALAELDYERTLAVEQLLLNRTGGKLVQLPGGVTAQYKNKKLILEKQ